MRMSQEEKARSHGRIVASASRMLRERGLEGASVAEMMSDAGMTHGGFYKHFPDREALVAEALAAAFDEVVARLEGPSGTPPDAAALAGYRASYVSRGHVDNPALGCPVAGLGVDVGRGSEGLKQAFACGVERIIARIAPLGRGSAAARREAALRDFATMVGAVVIARASGPALGAEVLAACRDTTREAPGGPAGARGPKGAIKKER